MSDEDEQLGGGAARVVSDDPERRAAQAEIEGSDRRVRHSDPAVRAALRRRRRRTHRVYLGLGLGLLVALLGYLAAYFLPVLAVRQVAVTGTTTVSTAEVEARAGLASGTPLLQVDTHEIARRVSGIPRVSEVTVVRDYPSTVRIEVVERDVAFVVVLDGVPHLVDERGVDFGRGEPPPGTPRLTVSESVQPRLPQVVRDLSGVLSDVRSVTGLEVTAVDVRTPAAIILTLPDGRLVEWGEATRTREKAVALRAVLGQPGRVWNVSNPAMPASR